MAIRLLAAALLVGLLGGPAIAAPPRAAGPPRVSVALISEGASLEPGSPLWVGLRQRIAPGWHTYWLNPGDSGEAPTIEWALPIGFAAEPIVWPQPERLPVGPAMTYGYTKEVVLLTRITVPADARPGSRVTLRGRASWLVCEKICIPEEAELALTLPVAAGRPAPAATAPAIERARRAVPAPSPWPATLHATAETVTVSVAAPRLAADRISDVWFFPARWGVIDHAAPQAVAIDRDGITLRIARGALPDGPATDLDGVLVMRERLDQETVSQAFAIRATADPGPSTVSAGLSLVVAIGLALAGGLILNLMPCVLPVLSVKAIALVSHVQTSSATMRRHGLAYTAGVLASFAALAGTLVALRAGGAEVGWGFQLQSPVVVGALAYLLFALGLSLSGLLVLGARLTGVGHGLAARPGYRGSFFTGALAAVAATPCTAPFMGVAVGYALTQPPVTALLVFETLGLGLALPFLALSLIPAWRRLLPRPGPWMERLKQALAFPLYASVAWLVWVVSRQAGPDGVALVLIGLLLIGFAAWIHHATRAGTSMRWRRAATVLALACVAGALGLGPLVARSPSPAPAAAAPTGAAWEPFTAERLAALRAKGTPVFVNFTAAWCITCLVNERVALSSPAVTEAFARRGVVYLRADWTSKSPEIAALLESFGRSGVPLYVLYRGGGAPPRVLPQILSEGTIIEAVGKL
jgi:thiol:disulfide interchange protein/DsbC/DsbD-like thiol-disulfide interchange protein